MAETQSSSPPSTSNPASSSLVTVDDHRNQSKPDHRQSENALPAKRKRNLPGNPDPDAEVIALSPKTLLATNRFVCEICNKGFQRDQNLQLHRRGHNLPWKLRQRSGGEAARKRVYVCPEPTCAHHDPSRALGDLTGIKKHFCRKHGEKSFKCERCSKTYAVRSDWKAHMKTCGTREYPCDCGTLFSRRDSFITHRAFCDALAQSSLSRPPPPPIAGGDSKAPAEVPPDEAASSPPPPPLTPQTEVLSPVLSVHSSAAELPENQPPPPQEPAALTTSIAPAITSGSSGGPFFSTALNPSTSEPPEPSQGPAFGSSQFCPLSGTSGPTPDPISLSLSPSFYGPSSFFQPTTQNHHHPIHPHYVLGPQPALSATALLQKAAQMGSKSSGSSFLRGLGLGPPSPPGPHQGTSKIESSLMVSGLGLGLNSGGSSGLNDLMMGSSIFGERPPTLDFLGLGMAGDDRTQPVGLSTFLGPAGNMGNDSFGGTWGDESSDRKPSL
ncbi:Protein indeterminate-domain 1 [Striga hermonthica]|uniref:Protein indeterminate-domain 1 n=1 Tax=Striga hermonthica TaxID=68872 RepID=A0A9N7NCC2_STRHE|nr:Protein indeterminate-domain 1 [Striga hermonthica]